MPKNAECFTTNYVKNLNINTKGLLFFKKGNWVVYFLPYFLLNFNCM